MIIMDKENIPIRKARKAAGLTQAGLSKYLNIPLSTIERWESGKSAPTPWSEKLIIDKLEQYMKEHDVNKEE